MIEMPLAWHEIHLQADSIGIFEEDGVVARSPRAVLGWMHHFDLVLDQKCMQVVDVLPRSSAKADVVKADASLIESEFAIVFR